MNENEFNKKSGQQGSVFYRGVPKEDILESIDQAMTMIRSLALGPETEKLLDEWEARGITQAITQAQDSQQLAQAMGGAGIFRRMREIFDYHAVQDTDGEGLAIMQALSRWDAFSGMELADYRPTDAEWDRYLLREYAALAHDEGAQGMVRAAELLAALAEHQPYQLEDHEDALNDVMLMLADDKDECLAEVDVSFVDGDLRERHLMKTLFMVMSGQAEAQQNLERQGAVGLYGVVFDEIEKGMNFGDIQDVIGDANEKMFEALKPYYETGEVEMTAVGTITRDFEKMGLVFHATERAARAVAEAFPERKVIDGLGNEIGKKAETGPDSTADSGPDKPAP